MCDKIGDYISREAAKKAVCRGCNAEFEKDPCEPCDCTIMAGLEAIPSTDARPVVLCRDCKCYKQSHYIDNHMECTRSRFPVHSVDFCSFGEKREEADGT